MLQKRVNFIPFESIFARYRCLHLTFSLSPLSLLNDTEKERVNQHIRESKLLKATLLV